MSLFRCWSTRNLLDLYADGRLTEGAAARIAAHLKACETCRLEAEAHRALPAEFAEKVEVPAGLAEAILKKVEAGESAAPRLEMPRLEPAQALAALYLAVVVGGHALPGTPSQAFAQDPVKTEALR